MGRTVSTGRLSSLHPRCPSPEGLDAWGDAAAAVLVAVGQGGIDPDGLLDRLEDLPPPMGDGQGPMMQLWQAGGAPQPCDAADCDAVLQTLFSCS
ncbi:MAG: hypothetical protein HC783_10165 [Rhodobacteraceae bacterium]|nr:hypothetical protein [Paracoccaceae bacterium]